MTEYETLKRCPKCGSEPMSLVYTSNPPQYGYSHCGIDSGCSKSRSEAVAKWNEQVYLHTHQEKASKFTDEEIIKALKCCCEMENKDCLQCPYFSVPFKSDCVIRKTNDVIKLINYLTTTNKNHEATIKRADELIDTLKAEIEMNKNRAKDFVEKLGYVHSMCDRLDEAFTKAKTEAIKEFAERLSAIICDKIEQSMNNPDGDNYFITDVYTTIEDLAKEMTEVR